MGYLALARVFFWVYFDRILTGFFRFILFEFIRFYHELIES